MGKDIKVSKLNLKDLKSHPYDLVIGTIGYEKRANYFFKQYPLVAKYKIAIGFTANRVINYTNNLNWYKGKNFEIFEPEEKEFPELIANLFRRESKGDEIQSICIDISSMTRYRIACLIYEIVSTAKNRKVKIDFVYSYSKFFKPSDEDRPILHSGPVIPFFAGWTDIPHKENVTIIGLGFEGAKAMGVWEYLESQRVYSFIPCGHEKKYDIEIEKRNKYLFSQMERTNQSSNIIYYQFNEPYNMFIKLESLCTGICRNVRLVIIPFGPKPFALASMLVALLTYPDISVWRVSSGEKDAPTDRIPNGVVVGLTLSINI